MKRYKYTITFYDYWQSGSGLGAGAKADSLCVKTKEGLPFVSGKTLKGLLADFLNEQDQKECLGESGIGKEIVSVFENAELPKAQAKAILHHGLKEELYTYITTTAIENGIAKTDTLRTKEVVIPLTLEGEIALKDTCKVKIEAAMAQVKRLGTGRTRGFGRCDIKLGEEIPQGTQSNVSPVQHDSITLTCTFESDVVLLGSANTEGKSKPLDFIPGSAVLGIVAKGLKDKKINDIDFETLLNGTIRFGEGSLLHDHNLAYSMPFSFFKPKIPKEDDANSTKTYHFPYISDDEHRRYQMQQRRNGYITHEGHVLHVDYDYQQKSSYNREERRSQEGEMYGYPAMVKGTTFALEISAPKEKLEGIVAYLCTGTHRLGKSKSAQYGKVRFHVAQNTAQVQTKQIPKSPHENLLFLYAKSRIALHDENGVFTYEPTTQNLGLQSGNIRWDYTQIRTASFTPYNGVQQTTTYERLVIERGSVIVVEGCTDELPDRLVVGAFQNEGFGELLVNPSFLCQKFFEEKPLPQDTSDTSQTPPYTGEDKLLCYLQSKRTQKEQDFELVALVDQEEKKFKNITNSQWGALRAFALKPTTTNIRSEVETFISSGKNKDMWEKNGNKGKLLRLLDDLGNDETKRRKFITYLAMRMQSQGGAA